MNSYATWLRSPCTQICPNQSPWHLAGSLDLGWFSMAARNLRDITSKRRRETRFYLCISIAAALAVPVSLETIRISIPHRQWRAIEFPSSPYTLKHRCRSASPSFKLSNLVDHAVHMEKVSYNRPASCFLGCFLYNAKNR
ncbi:hypothetical protein HYPSUDRAFT_448831 [Hypholoma sublateritium FD-334 SS-4]|uniref:Uncharacterized protein n=1 Tax=Hypholoma sublateritium (strain FD-334 SS-4) TaxID=945553 RepID=A0A0D2P1M6_HYPSF|nr:hypothetical protein HYPSUDRAFT_448831 [Hypholoma sublateritium FD-334 SS-4]